MARSSMKQERIGKMGEGIVCKVWNVSATQKKGSNQQLSDSIDYILDEEKTEAALSNESQEHFNEKQLGRECQYIENDIKTIDGAYVAVQNLVSADVAGAVKEMMDVKKFYGKLGGRAALHGIISLPVEESGKEHAGELMALCADVMKKMFPNHQAVFAVHTNTDNLHVHFIVNSVGLDGKKIHQPKNFINEVLHPCINEYAKKYGFTPNPEWDKLQKEKISDYVGLKMDLRKAIDLAIEGADSFDDFRENMKAGGFRINCGKHISVKREDMDKAMRTYQLGANYTKEAIVERIMSRKLAFEKIPESDTLRAMMARSKKVSDTDAYTPVFTTMKKYRDMSAEERRAAISQLKSGINPWRMHTATSWQMKEIADNLNMTVRAEKYIKAYSNNGTIDAALKSILEQKKECAAEKKKLKMYMRPYKPVIDIYRRMQKIERKAYLYEHEGRAEYRGEYEEYRDLTRRLKRGYEKSVSDVAQFLEAYEQQYLLLNAQMGELSQEYRELKKYAETRGYSITQDKGLWETLGHDELKNEVQRGIFDTGIRYMVSSNNPDVMIRIVKNPYVDRQGKTQENISVSLLSRYGEILEKHDLSEGTVNLKKFVSKLENEYNLKNFESFKNISLAREYSARCRNSGEMNEPAELRAIMARSGERTKKNHQRKTYSVTQAINLLSAGKKTGVYVIVNAENPSYMGIVFSDESGIRLKISDLNGRLQEEIAIPSFKNRNQDGYNAIADFSRKYGFSDKLYAFESLEEARTYSATEIMKNTMR